MVLALATYQALERGDQTHAVAKFRSSAQIDREVENFKSQIQNLKSPDDLYKNRRLMNFVLSAYGLDSEINAMGRVKAALNSDLTDLNSVVNRLTDKRFREAASDLLIASSGVDNLKLPTVVSRVVDRYVSAEYEKLLGRQDPAIREARYFAKNIGKVGSIYELLGNPVLRSVVTDTLGLPTSLAIQPIESQAEAIRRRLDIAQFKTAATGTPQQTRANALADVASLTRAAAIADAATSRVDEVAQRLRTTLSGYDGLTALQDPGGANAAEIAVHTAAIPELVRQRGLLASAEASIGRLADSLNRMGTLRNLASDPTNAASLAAYKTEFATLAQSMHDEVSAGAIYRFDGTDQNLLDGSLTGPLTTAISSSGASVSLRAHDLSSFLAYVDTAALDFAAVTSASDTDELTATATAITGGGPLLGAVRDQLIEDRTAAATAIGRIANFTATLGTTALATARVSLSDADSRAQQIAAKLTQLRSVAASSAALDPSADRSTLSSQAAGLITDINTLIATPATGADNLLDSMPHDYALTGGKSLTIRAGALDNSIGTPLAGASVDDVASANTLIDRIKTELMPAIIAARDSWSVDKNVADQAATIFDPRGKLDQSVRTLSVDLAGIVQRAVSNGVNLLRTGQASVLVQLKGAAGSLTIYAQPGFEAAIALKLATALSQLPGNLGGAGGAYEALASATTLADDTARSLRSDRRGAETALLDAKRRLALAPAADASATPKLTEFTKRFIQRFLAARDAQTSTAQASTLLGITSQSGTATSSLASTPRGGVLGLFA